MAYIYQADVYCSTCGRKIKEEIDAERFREEQEPFDAHDEGSFDSSEYPKHYDPENEESDAPENCASGICSEDGTYGKFLENQMTQEGYRYLKEMLDEHGAELPPHAKEWADFYGFAYFKQEWDGPRDWLQSALQAAVKKGVDGCKGCRELWGYLQALIGEVDADTIQDLFQGEMTTDQFFKESGWYSDEMADDE